MTPSEFEEWLFQGDFTCPACKQELSTENLRVECALCSEEIDYFDLAHLANEVVGGECPCCVARWEVDGFRTVFIAGSWSEAYFYYDWTADGKATTILEREGRSDYWEGLVHFCTAEEFISIYRDRRIKASATGLYGGKEPEASRAVCLTEATMANWDELKARHGEYGFVFRKRDIIRLSGAPAIYIPQSVLDTLARKRETIPATLRPYVNKLAIPSSQAGVKHDFLHEREWRVPQDIQFCAVQPYAITFPRRRPRIKDEELIISAAREFQELDKLL